jgi:hypothetical protein
MRIENTLRMHRRSAQNTQLRRANALRSVRAARRRCWPHVELAPAICGASRRNISVIVGTALASAHETDAALHYLNATRDQLRNLAAAFSASWA